MTETGRTGEREETNTKRKHYLGNVTGKFLWIIANLPFVLKHLVSLPYISHPRIYILEFKKKETLEYHLGLNHQNQWPG